MYVKSSWEKGANIELSEEDWINTCRDHSTTSSSGLWTPRFFCPKKIKQSKIPENGQCWRMCGNICADRVHIFWDFFLLVGCDSRDKDIFLLFIRGMFHLT